MKEKGYIIAIDGPAGSGKSTTAKHVAKYLGYVYVDTGAMYRAITLAALQNNCMSPDLLQHHINSFEISLTLQEDGQHTYLNGKDVSIEIRQPEISENVSFISSLQFVRTAMVTMQRNLGKHGGIVMDGRDIGTVVFPDADFKFFMEAGIEERAKRRLQEMQDKGIKPLPSLTELIEQIAKRDHYDSSREIDPLRMADDAILIDTSLLSIDEQVRVILDYIQHN